MTGKAITKPRSPRQNQGVPPSGDAETPLPLPQRVSRLKSLDDVRLELAKIYREARLGQLPMNTAKGLAYLLQGLPAVIKETELEKRVNDIEEQDRGAKP